MAFISLSATVGLMPAQAQESQAEREAMLREVDVLNAARNHEAALQIAHKLVASSDVPGASESFLALALLKLSFAYAGLSRLGDAETAQRQSLAVLERGGAPDEVMAALWGGLGDLSFRQGRFKESVDLYLRAISLADKHASTSEEMLLARLQFELALNYQQLGMDDLAEPLLRTSLASHKTLYKPDAVQLAAVSRVLGNSLRRNGKLDEAQTLLESATTILGSRPDMELFQANAIRDMGHLYLAQHDLPKAITAFTQSLELFEKVPLDVSSAQAGVLLSLSKALEESGSYPAAIGPARRSLALLESKLGPDAPGLLLFIDQVAKIERKLGNVDTAKLLETRSEALKARVELNRTDPLETMATIVERVPPAYPLLANRMGREGNVVVRVLIGADGSVAQATIQESSGDRRLDEAAIASVQATRFSPARSRGGRAIASSLKMPISFVLEGSAPHAGDAQQAYDARVASAVRSNITRPAPATATMPAEVTLQVAPDGKVLDHSLTKSSGDPAWDAAVLAGVARTLTLPLDTNGLAPSLVVLSMKPNE